MNKLFITLYDFFERRRALLCTVLAVLVAAMGAAALQLRFSENITGFFPDGERKAAAAFSNLKIKDKIAVMINTREGAEGTGATAGSSTNTSTTTRWGCRSGHWENYRS